MKIKTRAQYMAKEVTHSEYYGQFVTEAIKNTVVARFGFDRLKLDLKRDEHLNTIPLHQWDALAPAVLYLDRVMRKDHGDFMSEAGAVCILKEAARQAVAD